MNLSSTPRKVVSLKLKQQMLVSGLAIGLSKKYLLMALVGS